MPLQMVNPQHRLAQSRRQTAGHSSAHQQSARQPRAAGKRQHIYVVQLQLRVLKHLLGKGQHTANVVAAGQLGHHAPIGLVQLNLAVQGLPQQLGHLARTGLHQSHPSFVARRLNAEHPNTHRITNPPSTSKVCPVTNRLHSLAKNSTGPATSSGVAKRRKGV